MTAEQTAAGTHYAVIGDSESVTPNGKTLRSADIFRITPGGARKVVSIGVWSGDEQSYQDALTDAGWPVIRAREEGGWHVESAGIQPVRNVADFRRLSEDAERWAGTSTVRYRHTFDRFGALDDSPVSPDWQFVYWLKMSPEGDENLEVRQADAMAEWLESTGEDCQVVDSGNIRASQLAILTNYDVHEKAEKP